MIHHRIPLLIVVSLATLSCSKDATQEHIITPLVPVTRIDVIPIRATITVGETQQLSAETKDASGTVLTGRQVIWSSSDTAVAKITPDGLATAIRPGWATLKATVESATGSSDLTILAPPPPPGQIARVDVFPVGAYLEPGRTLQLTAVAKDVTNQTIAGHAIVWTSRNPNVMTVSPSGLVTALRVGKDAIDATINGVRGHTIIEVAVPPVAVATVDVSPASATLRAGGAVRLAAATKDAGGNVLKDRTVTWSSSDRAIATVNSSGWVTAVAAGKVTITATSEGKTGTSTITVD